MQRWSIVVPVKRLSTAKSRLRGATPAELHEAMVLAMALDTVSAVLACPSVARVLVVTDDATAARALAALGAHVLADSPAAGLNAALEHGAATARILAPDGRVAALGADLPALDFAELTAALAQATDRAFVADAHGTGTTLLAAAPGDDLRPRYGPGSAAAHAASGARGLTGLWPSLRRDVDTAADLRAAKRLGVGPHVEELSPTRR